MFTVKLSSFKKNKLLKNTASTIANFIKGSLNKDINIISDKSSIEMIASSPNILAEKDSSVVAELLIKKTIVINNSDLEDREKLDKFLSEIKNFCEQASKIEDSKYIPIEFRKRE